MRIGLRQMRAESERVPFGYGVAWFDPMSCMVVAYPIPLNKIAGLIRRAYFWWQQAALKHDPYEAAYLRGMEVQRTRLEDMRNTGFARGYEHAFRVLLARVDHKPDPPVPFGIDPRAVAQCDVLAIRLSKSLLEED